MKKNLTLIITLVGILALIFLSQTTPTQTGTVKSISTSQTKTTIQLKNNTTELIIFEKTNLGIKSGDKIKFQGKTSTYKNKNQIIISKISKISE